MISMQKYPGKDNNINNTRGTQQKPYKDGRNYQPVIGLTNKQTEIIFKYGCEMNIKFSVIERLHLYDIFISNQ